MDEIDVESEAKGLGWVPKEEFKGNEAKWVDAETYVERGKHVMPLLKKNNETLLANQQRLQAQVEFLTKEVRARSADFDTLQEFHNEEVTRRVAETKRELMAKLKEAKQEADYDTEIEIQDQLQQLNAAGKETEEALRAKRAQEVTQQEVQMTPAYLSWSAKNPWYGQDQVRSLKTTAIAAEIKQEQPDLLHEAFFAELDKRLENWGKPVESNGSGRPASKVESSRGGGGSTSGNSGRTYADLPPEAKAACDKFAERFVSADGRFKSVAEYRKHYVAQLERQGAFDGR